MKGKFLTRENQKNEVLRQCNCLEPNYISVSLFYNERTDSCLFEKEKRAIQVGLQYLLWQVSQNHWCPMWIAEHMFPKISTQATSSPQNQALISNWKNFQVRQICQYLANKFTHNSSVTLFNVNNHIWARNERDMQVEVQLDLYFKYIIPTKPPKVKQEIM